MKRLLCLIGNMDTGGAETFLMKLYRNLDREKYQMDFCVNVEKKCFYDDEIESLGGRIFRIPPKSQNLKEFKKQLYELIKKERYEYVLRVCSNAIGFMELKIAKSAGAKVCAVRSSNSSDGGSFKVKLLHMLGKVLYNKYIDVRIAPSDLAAKHTFGERAYKNGEVNILHNAVDLDIYKYQPEEGASVRAELGIAEDKLVVGHIGRFMPQKNHAFLLRTFAEIKKKNEKAVLLLVGGNGELEESTKALVSELGLSDSVVFAGIRSDVPRLLSAMNVFVFPSLYEGMPNTVIEAQATGLPCVIADTITREADITGLVKYLPLDLPYETWAESALDLAVDPSERKSKAEDLIASGYRIDEVVKEFSRICFGEK